MNWKPNKWIAATLTLLFPSLGMLYIARLRLAVIYFYAFTSLVIIQFWFIARGHMIPAYVYLMFYMVLVTHTYITAARAPAIYSRPWFSRWYGLLAAILTMVAILIATASTTLVNTLFEAYLFEIYRVNVELKYASISRGDSVIVKKIGYGNYESHSTRFSRDEVVAPLKRGDVLVYEFTANRGDYFAQRLIGLPGDHIQYRDKQVFVNGIPLSDFSSSPQWKAEIAQEEGHLFASEDGTPPNDLDDKVKPEHLFLLGDNRGSLNPGRHWVTISYDQIVGKAVLILGKGKIQPIVSADPQ